MTSHLVPHLNVFATNLIFLSELGHGIHWRDIKKVISEDCGRVDFIETFEAWRRRGLGYVILQFRTAEGRRRFTQEMSREWYERNFHCIPTFSAALRGPEGREHFFKLVMKYTGVDMLECRGIPPRRWLITRVHRRSEVNDYESRRSPISYRSKPREKSRADYVRGSSRYMSPHKSSAGFHRSSTSRRHKSSEKYRVDVHRSDRRYKSSADARGRSRYDSPLKSRAGFHRSSTSYRIESPEKYRRADVRGSSRYMSPQKSRADARGRSRHRSPMKSRSDVRGSSRYMSPQKSRADVRGRSRYDSPLKSRADVRGRSRYDSAQTDIW